MGAALELIVKEEQELGARVGKGLPTGGDTATPGRLQDSWWRVVDVSM